MKDANEIVQIGFMQGREAESALLVKRNLAVQPLTPHGSSEPTVSLTGTMNVSWMLKTADAQYVWRHGQRVLQWTIDMPMDWFVDSYANDAMEHFSDVLLETIQNFFVVQPTISTPHQQ